MATVRQYDGDNAIERWRHCDDTTATVRYDYRIVAPDASHKNQTKSDSRNAGDSLGTLDALYHLYTAPISVYATNTISFLIFLGLCSYVVLVELEVRVTASEYVIWVWTLTLLCEELRQLISSDGSTAIRKLRYWFASYWNQYDMAMFIVGIAAIIARLTVKGDDEFDSVRYLYSLTVAMFYVRSLQGFLVEEKLGPKIIMLGQMIIDLIVFVRVFLIFLLSFGIMYTANLYPNSRPSLQLLKRIFYVPYWQIYGENFLEILEGDENGCTRNESVWRDNDDMRCPESKFLVPVLGALYMFLTNILLINLLIAMFSYTFQTIQERSEKIWRFYFYSIVREFYERPVIPHPFIIFSHMVRIICHVGCGNDNQSDDEFRYTGPLGSMKHLVENEDLNERENLRSAGMCEADEAQFEDTFNPYGRSNIAFERDSLDYLNADLVVDPLSGVAGYNPMCLGMFNMNFDNFTNISETSLHFDDLAMVMGWFNV
ncbi:hypothetical protein DPMN_099703 [Dreissena polymorpha]|uniref:Ion transport domain-containing protein n=1 Tax=Dreissena polymorpha TaxID=45954 RepID=A0A9D4LFY6_DREPO|nr:hypothetical protein DPMN_099703 [Dreissena polymorpha]